MVWKLLKLPEAQYSPVKKSSFRLNQALRQLQATICAVLLLVSSTTPCAAAPPGSKIELEWKLPKDEAKQLPSGVVPTSVLDNEEFNDFNYQARRDAEPTHVNKLATFKFETPLAPIETTEARSSFVWGPKHDNAAFSSKQGVRVPANSGSARIIGKAPAIKEMPSIASVSPIHDASDANEITITFSRDLINIDEFISSYKNSVLHPPITISPAVDGSWKWFSPRALIFEPTAKRFPRATEFIVSVPANLEGLKHQRLTEGKTWRFMTPRVVPSQVYGGFSQVGRSVPMQFNQPVKIDSALSKIHMKIEGSTIPLRLATKAEAELLLGKFMDEKGAYCFVPAKPLPPDKDGSVTVEAGIEGVEGPLASLTELEQKFHTEPDQFACISPLLLTTSEDQPWIIKFAGPSDSKTSGIFNYESLKSDLFSIVPPLPHQKITATNDSIYIRGVPEPGKTYLLTISAELPGTNSTLGKEAKIALNAIKTETPEVFATPSQVYVVTPSGPTELKIFSKGTTNLEAFVYDASAIYPEQPPSAQTPYTDLSKHLPILQKTLACLPYAGSVNVATLDFAPFRKTNHRQLLLTVRIPGNTVVQEATTWIQLISSNVTCLTSDTTSKIVCTNLSTGKPEDAISANFLPETPFQKVGRGEFFLPKSLHVQQKSAVEVITKGGPVLLPNESRYSHWEHEDYKIPKVAVFCTGDFEHAVISEPVKFAGFLSMSDDAGAKSCAPDGVITCSAEDSDGNILDNGTAKVHNGLFSGQLLITEKAKTGTGKLRFDYKNSVDGDKCQFAAELRILATKTSAAEKTRFQFEPGLSSYGLPCEGKIHAVSDSSEFSYLYPESKKSWSVWATYAQFHPQGWNDFQFGQQRIATMGDEWAAPAPELNNKDSLAFSFLNTSSMPISMHVDSYRELGPGKSVREDKSFVVQPADLLIGIKSRVDSQAGKTTIDLESIVTDAFGNPEPGKSVQLRILKDVRAINAWENPTVINKAFTSSDVPTKQHLVVQDDTDLLLVAAVQDENGKISRTILDISPSKTTSEPSNAAPITVSQNKDKYLPGERCVLKLIQPFDSYTGFGAISTERSIDTFRIEKQAGSREISFTIPGSSVGKLSGIIKLFESNPVNKICREAEGSFELNVEPKIQKIRVKLSCENQGDAQNQQALVVRVLDAANSPVSNANVILKSRLDNYDAFSTDDFNFLMQNLTKTHLFCSSLTRAPVLSTLANARQPIIELPGQLRPEKYVDRALSALPEHPSNGNIFPLQTLRTDENGIARYVFAVPEKHDSVIIQAYVMTESGAGFEGTSIILPSKNSIPKDSELTNQYDTHAASGSSGKIQSHFQNFAVFQHSLLNQGDQQSTERVNRANLTPLAAVLSNSMLTPLAASADRMLRQQPQTSDLRAARLITLLSLLPFVSDLETRGRYESAIAEDTKTIVSLNDSGFDMDMSWIPKNMVHDNVTPKFEPTMLLPFSAHALLLSKKRGFYDWPGILACRTDLLARRMYDFEGNPDSPKIKADTAYSGYVGSKIHQFFEWPRISSMFRVQSLAKTEKDVEKLPDEAIAWLMPFRNKMDFFQPTVEAIEKKFAVIVANVVSAKKQDVMPVPRSLRQLSAFLIAELETSHQNETIIELAKSVSNALNRDEYQYNDIERAFAAVALAAYCDRFGESSPAKAILKLQNGSNLTMQFPANTPLIKSVNLSPDSDIIEFTGTQGVSCGLVEAAEVLEKKEIANGITVKRTLVPEDRGSKACLTDSKRALHCKAGDALVEHIEFVASKPAIHIVLSEPSPGPEISSLSALPHASQTSAEYKIGNYSLTWPQAIVETKDKLYAYGSDISSGYYEFTYKRTFPKVGTFQLPAVTVQNPYDHDVYGVTSEQTIIVSP